MQRIMRGISKSFKLIDVSFLSQKSRNLSSVKAYDLTLELIYPNKQMCLSKVFHDVGTLTSFQLITILQYSLYEQLMFYDRQDANHVQIEQFNPKLDTPARQAK